MTMRDLMPWNRGTRSVPVRRYEDDPLREFRRPIDRVFDEFWRGFDLAPFGRFERGFGIASPHVDIAETDTEIEVSVELPGMDENDIDVSLTDEALTVKGEKKAEREERKKDYFVSERSFGSFQRSIPLPRGLDGDKASAKFEKGVLTVTVPRSAEAQARVKKIAVKAS